MKRTRFVFMTFIMGMALAALLLSGCSSTPQTGNPKTSSAIPSFDFDGFWQTPGKTLMWINKHAFIYQNMNGDILNTGVFTHTDSQLVFNFDVDEYLLCNYTINSGTLDVYPLLKNSNQWANGNWIKLNDVSLPNNRHPLVGYWEQKTDKLIRILYINPFGWGDLYVCDLEYKLTYKWEIDYDEKNFTQFVMKTPQTQLEDQYGSYSVSVTATMKYVFDGADLLTGTGDDMSKYNRYVKK